MSAPVTGTLPLVAPLLAMRGSADAAACEGDACLVPGAGGSASPAAPADASDAGSPAADLARVRDAIDSGRAI
ncbi:hypothetical protein QFZ62_000472 [Clavibacter sp. B3I6]|uniref:hypothetical protein n=1 Tax=Clavibacter sp. B3I6 TaxID=3042268 RepID=UPI00277F46C3|nr:hypothetical protein [Clavibacter sp. B3I6]MDQ0743164.1 hypothetical protein [Clavibacter sp. B3I6]